MCVTRTNPRFAINCSGGSAFEDAIADVMALLQLAGDGVIHATPFVTNGALLRERSRRRVNAIRPDVVDDRPPVLAQAPRDLGVPQECWRGCVEAVDQRK
jgi:hypothetical protein